MEVTTRNGIVPEEDSENGEGLKQQFRKGVERPRGEQRVAWNPYLL